MWAWALQLWPRLLPQSSLFIDRSFPAGKKVSQQALLDVIITASAEREEELFQRIVGVKLPLSRDEIERLMGIPTDWGVETREEEIDRYLYGLRGGRKWAFL